MYNKNILMPISNDIRTEDPLTLLINKPENVKFSVRPGIAMVVKSQASESIY